VSCIIVDVIIVHWIVVCYMIVHYIKLECIIVYGMTAYCRCFVL